MNYKKLFGLTIVVALLFTIAPVYAWTYPDCSNDSRYEKFGPRLDRIYIGLYATQEAEWEDLKLGKIDMTDWPLNRAYLDELSLNPDVKIEYYGPELGFDAVDINCDNGPNKEVGYPNPVYQINPAGFNQDTGQYLNSSGEFRKALWRTLNRDYIVANIWKGLGDPMYTVCTTAQGLYLHPNATVPVESGGIMWSFNLVKAAKILDDAGFVDGPDADTWREFPVSLGGDGNNINLIYYGRSDDKLRNDIAVAQEGWIESIGVQVDLRLRDRSVTYPAVMIEKNFHLYTAGWSIGRDADSGMGLYYSGYYWHPGFCYNYGRVNCTDFDDHFLALEQANTNEEVIAWAWKCQYDYNMKAFGTIPAVCNSGYKAYSKTYTGGTDGVPVSPDDGENEYRGQLWKQIVNLGSYGVDNYWTFLNAYPEGHPMGDGENMTMRYGFKTALLEKPSNPCYAEWLWDWNILGLTYESLLYRDPYTYTWMSWLCKDFEVITWVDPEDGQTKSGVRFTLRDDVYWSDGTPFTAADIEYSLVELDDELINLGYGAPWWYSNTIYIKSFYIIDPCNVEVLLDIKSYFAVGWIGGCTILPKHIWKALVEKEKAAPGTVNFWGAYVDPDVIGTGPYRFVEYEPIAPGHVLLIANAPSTVVKTSWPGSKLVHSPYGFFNYYPIYTDVTTLYEFKNLVPITDEQWMSTQWNMTKGEHKYIGTHWKFTGWLDSNYNGILDEDDQILMTLKVGEIPVGPSIWHKVFKVEKTGPEPWVPGTVTIWTYWYSQKIYPTDEAAFGIELHNWWLNPIPNSATGTNTGYLQVEKIVKLSVEDIIPYKSGSIFAAGQWIHFENANTTIHLQTDTTIHFVTGGKIYYNLTAGLNPPATWDWMTVTPSTIMDFDYCTHLKFPEDMEIEFLVETGVHWLNAPIEMQIVHPHTVNLYACEPDKEVLNLHFKKCHYDIKVIWTIIGPPMIEVTKFSSTIIVPNPWLGWSKTYRFDFWVTIPEDIGGTTYYDAIGLPGYPYKTQLPAPDCKVDMKDVRTAAKAFGSYPGHSRWSPTSDQNYDYKIDMKDIRAIAKKFGWAC